MWSIPLDGINMKKENIGLIGGLLNLLPIFHVYIEDSMLSLLKHNNLISFVI